MFSESIKPVMIIGSMKCGTSTLYSHLIKHPEICECLYKEPEFFSLNLGKPEHKTDRYENLFSPREEHRYTLDGSTGYTKYPVEKGVPARIKAYGLDPFLIYIIRNPFDRIRSHYNFMQRKAEWALDIDDDHLINTSRYFTQLQQYKAVFPDKEILLVDFADLKQDPGAVVHRILKFIGAQSLNVDLNERSVANKTSAVNRTQVMLKHRVSAISKILPQPVKETMQKLLDVVLPREQEHLTPAQRESIRAKLADDMEGLRLHYGFDVGGWGF